jgi:hypothetical protein
VCFRFLSLRKSKNKKIIERKSYVLADWTG